MAPKDLPESRENDHSQEDPDFTPADIGKMTNEERESMLVYGVLRIATALEDLVDSMRAAAGDN